MSPHWRHVALAFALVRLASPASAQTTALFLDSQPGDYVGGGVQRSYTDVDTLFSASRGYENGVSISIVHGNYVDWWRTEFSSNDSALGTGTYSPATRFPFATFHGLDVSGSGRGCNELVGRFEIREAVYNPDGSVLRFAADFEQHCEDSAAALYGAVRYNSTISSLVPFDGAYPAYGLAITPAQNGLVVGDGLECGMGSTQCRLELTEARNVVLTASPATGYMFAGWTGACHGSRTITLNVNMQKTCSAIFEPMNDSAPNTMLFWTSQRGDYIGQGAREIFNELNTKWTITSTESGNGVSVAVTSLGSRRETRYQLQFRAPQGAILAPGTYSGATRAAFRTITPGLEVSGDGRGCNTVAGSFVVHEIRIMADGTVSSLAIDFEQRCDAAGGRLFGSLRLNSQTDPLPTILLNVDGAGRVSATPGPSGCTADCPAQLPLGTTTALSAFAGTGWIFAGWTGDSDCADRQTTVTAPALCVATFLPEPRVLAVAVEGEGRVTSIPSGIDCGLGATDCSASFAPGSVHLSVSAAVGWRFAEWQGTPGCSDYPDLTTDMNCRAVFVPVLAPVPFDFNDVIFQHESTGCMVVWNMRGAVLETQRWITPNCVSDSDWRISGVADFDHDGDPDLLFQHLQTGGLVVWLMDGVTYRQQIWLIPSAVSDPDWRVSAVADFDADGNPDLILQNRKDGRMVAWLLVGLVLKRQQWLTPSAVADPNWRIVGAGDVDRDGRPDLFFQNASSGSMVAWIMNGLAISQQEWVSPSYVSPEWRINAVADLTGDGNPDLLLQNLGDGRIVIWPLRRTQLIGQLWLGPGRVADPRWRIAGPR